MKKTSPDPPDIDSKRHFAVSKAHEAPFSPALDELTHNAPASSSSVHGASDPGAAVAAAHEKLPHQQQVSVSTLPGRLPASPLPQVERKGPVLVPNPTNDSASNNTNDENGSTISKKRRDVIAEARRTFRMALTYSWLNVLLVFVPIGIVVANVPGVHGGIIFAMNCIAVIPLAGLLSYATESVACNMGDSLGALLNVTFGNAVELIIL